MIIETVVLASVASTDESPVEKFNFFFAFYGLILGLAVAELLAGFAGIVRARAIRQIELQTALLAVLTFVVICATWIDAWESLKKISLDFSGLWAPILIATSYYLAASVVFPTDSAEFSRLGAYFSDRKPFIITMLLVAEVAATFTYVAVYTCSYNEKPAVFWLWQLPYKAAIIASFGALLFVKNRRANIGLLLFLIFLFLGPYWVEGGVSGQVSRAFGYSGVPC